MPVRKSAAKPLAKKIAAKKTAKKAVATPAKKTPAKKTVAGKVEETLVDRIAAGIVGGSFDGELVKLDDALTTRANAQAVAARKESASKPAAKKVSAPPKKVTVETTVEPTSGTSYGVSPKFKPLSGAKVKFIRFKADSAGEKSVVEMMTDKPGSPKGKKVVIPTAALVESKTAARKTAKK